MGERAEEEVIGKDGVPQENDSNENIHCLCVLVGMNVVNTYFRWFWTRKVNGKTRRIKAEELWKENVKLFH